VIRDPGRTVPRIEQRNRGIVIGVPGIGERRVPRRQVKVGLAPMKEALESKTEPADAGPIGRLVAEAQLVDGDSVTGGERPVIQNKDGRPTSKKGM